jgi:hypothetical protein
MDSWQYRPMEEAPRHVLSEHDGQELVRLLNEATAIMHRTLICDLHLHYHEDDNAQSNGWVVTLTVKGFTADVTLKEIPRAALLDALNAAIAPLRALPPNGPTP